MLRLRLGRRLTAQQVWSAERSQGGFTLGEVGRKVPFSSPYPSKPRIWSKISVGPFARDLPDEKDLRGVEW
jgi:hypothetical protein